MDLPVDRRINIGFVVNNLDVGGLEKVVLSLLNNLDRDRFTPHLICLDGAGRMAADVDLPQENRLVLQRKPGVRLPIIGLTVDPSLLPVFGRIRRFVREKKIDVLHAHNLGPLIYAGVATRLIPMRRRPQLVYSDHNQLFSMSPERARRVRWYLKLADHVIAVSQDLQRTLTERLQAPPERVQVLYNGVDAQRFGRADRNKVRRELGIADGDFVVGSAVVLSEHKGIGYLLDAAPAVLAQAPETRFVIAGDGPNRAALEEKARALALGDRVKFIGHRNDIPDVVAAFDVYVLPSLTEGLPLALLEALAVGNPILCTRVGGIPEIVEDGVNGYLVPPGDSAALTDGILRLRADPAFRSAVRERNLKKFAERFTLRTMVEGHARLFGELAARVAGAAWLLSVAV
jgi:glycosyltransferase involved in cell wall biosynthesis